MSNPEENELHEKLQAFFLFLEEVLLGNWTIVNELPMSVCPVAAEFYIVAQCTNAFWERMGIPQRLMEAGVGIMAESYDEDGVLVAALMTLESWKQDFPHRAQWAACEDWRGRKHIEEMKPGEIGWFSGWAVQCNTERG